MQETDVMHMITIRTECGLEDVTERDMNANSRFRLIGEFLIRQPDVLEKQRRQRESLHAALEVVHPEPTADCHSRQLKQRRRILNELLAKREGHCV